MQELLKQLRISAEVIEHKTNGIVDEYFCKLNPGERFVKLENRSKEIALGLKSYSLPIIRPILNEGLVSIEVLKNPPKNVSFEDVASNISSDMVLPLVLGKTHSGDNLVYDLVRAPHMIIAGASGSGKTVCLHSIVASLIRLDNVKLTLIDPKKVEFSYYDGIKNLAYDVVTDHENALEVLSDLVNEMESRFKKMARLRVNNIADYNVNKKKKMPYIVLIIDEFSDLMYRDKKQFQQKMCTLAQKSRACGIHIILASQHANRTTINGAIKVNFPTRISFQVASYVDSRVILDEKGAEKLLGKGDGLINAAGYNMIRFQGAYLSPEGIQKVCQENKRKSGMWFWR